jgi:outer membrane immunogenic protein
MSAVDETGAGAAPFASDTGRRGPLENRGADRMTKFALMAAVAVATVAMAPIAAHAEWYAGAAYTQYDLDAADVGGVTGRLGYRFNPNFAVEGEGTLGVEDDDNAELNGAYGAYAVGILPLGTGGFDVFGRAGYQQFDVDGAGPQPDIDEGGLSYGAGVGWRFGAGFGLRADYTRTEADEEEIDAISLGGVVNF